MKTTTLYFKEGSSDKVYQATIEPKGSGFVVNFAFGRRGSTLNTGTKTQAPVDRASAEKLFEKLVREKKAKGYTEGENSTHYSTEQTMEYSGILPQLLNPIDEDQMEKYIASPEWVMQEKFDGKRLLLLKQGNGVRGINRKGLFVGIPECIQKDAMRIEGDILVDGEAVGDTFYAFDLLKQRNDDLRAYPYAIRLENLQTATQNLGVCSFRCVISWSTEEAKREHLEYLRRVNAEGVVFKNRDACYTSGRPNSGGTQFKCKLYATASFIVKAVNRQRSVELSLLNEGKPVTAGNVSIPLNHAVPSIGEIVEVRYLYAFVESGSVYQPLYLGKREDVDFDECTVSQLKFKPSSEQADE